MATGKKEDVETKEQEAAKQSADASKAQAPAKKIESKIDKAAVLKEKLKESSDGLVHMLESQADEGLWDSFVEAHAQEIGKSANIPPEDARKMLGKLLAANIENITAKKEIPKETLEKLISVVGAEKKKSNPQEKAA